MVENKLLAVGVGSALMAIFAWVIAMVAVPAWVLREWHDLQTVWHSWQSLNASIIAVLASFLVAVTGYFIARRDARIAEATRKKNFRAYVALIALELHAISKGVERDALELVQSYQPPQPDANGCDFKPADGYGVLDFDVSKLSECVRFANEDQALLLTALILRSQIYQARAEWLADQERPLALLELCSAMFDVAEMKAIVDRLFQLARAPSHGNYDDIQIHEIISASRAFQMRPEDYLLSHDNEMTFLNVWRARLPKSIDVQDEELRKRSYVEGD